LDNLMTISTTFHLSCLSFLLVEETEVLSWIEYQYTSWTGENQNHNFSGNKHWFHRQIKSNNHMIMATPLTTWPT
jgi:D-alanyl-lipoteichoic acid acyltransferase DltB (MBOAT superfamily)